MWAAPSKRVTLTSTRSGPLYTSAWRTSHACRKYRAASRSHAFVPRGEKKFNTPPRAPGIVGFTGESAPRNTR